MINQFKMQEGVLSALCGMTAKQFVFRHRVRAVRGVHRLIEEKVPATTFMASGTHKSAGAAALEAGTAFVTALDAIDMGHKTKEELWSPVTNVLSVLNRIPSLPHDFTATATMTRWVKVITELELDQSLDDDQCRQLRFDIDKSYQQLKDHLSSGGGSSSGAFGGAGTGGIARAAVSLGSRDRARLPTTSTHTLSLSLPETC